MYWKHKENMESDGRGHGERNGEGTREGKNGQLTVLAACDQAGT